MTHSRPSPRPALAGTIEALSSKDRRVLAQLAARASRELGIRFPEGKYSMIFSRLQRRLRAVGLDSLDAVTTNKTDFFREPKHFQLLTTAVLPQLARERGHAKNDPFHVSVWCAGCSTGEEPYTLAMVLSEFAREWRGFSFDIVATDISTRVLERARRAVYPEATAAPIVPWLRQQYLLRSKDPHAQLVRVAPELRQLVRFQRLNFMDERYPLRGPFDVIFFRNVMIYFDRPTQEAVIGKQLKLLRPDGYLFISHSESLAGLNLPLEAAASAVFRRSRA